MKGWQDDLARLETRGMLRSLRSVAGAQGAHVSLAGEDVLLLCSNNYLGLAAHPALVEAACAATARFGVGSGGSRLISGTMEPHVRLEERLAAFKGTEAALLFNSGYAANTGILQGLCGEDDLIFSDALNHASIIDGCRLSRARTVVYPHRDVAALEALMAQEAPGRRGRWLIVTDGVFSMDGVLAPLPELVALKERFDALLMVDDAHGTGVLGATGRGTAEHLGCLAGIDLHMGTLGKALGCCGAYLAADRTVIDILINYSRSFIFSTSLAPAVPAAACAALDIVDSAEGARLRRSLHRNREVFAKALQKGGLDLLGSATQIVPVLTRDPAPTMAAVGALLKRGIFVQGIRPPTVAAGSCRLRATVMAVHDEGELLEAAAAIIQVLETGA
ncbi:8-amino-7-oxononanoate synthase [Desulfuromonas soudanensis]|uniref:8-amino-7-ketopelargonate synthase n=1 Tax=Desulfuromonas soudanensis TaxID=1603606 RepID=A0A0M4D005_9BACT|nr:8-amino-7-oxononanoate synthase [Desulfuromonas soudanensis]ALC16202.1 8-amino-7-oxononanoate synthase [Desulfuromonas soudanensis]